jgi:hypothetical protein
LTIKAKSNLHLPRGKARTNLHLPRGKARTNKVLPMDSPVHWVGFYEAVNKY